MYKIYQNKKEGDKHVYSSDELYQHLKFITNEFEENKIDYWLLYGSLLGGIRQNDIIPYDYDFDLGANLEDCDKILSLNQNIEKFGYEIKKSYLNEDKLWKVSLKIFYNKIPMGDIYLYHKFRDSLMRRFDPISGVYFWPKSTFPKYFIDKLIKIKIRDKLFFAPRDPQILLEHWYGKTWNIPIKSRSQGGKYDCNSDYYGGNLNLKLNFLINHLKNKKIFIQPFIDKQISVIYPPDQQIWVKENEMIF
jgi:hypothetical protein